MDRTASLASSPESTTVQTIPLRTRASATAPICAFGATRENSATAPLLGPATDGFPGGPVADEVPTLLTADFSQALVDQRNSHGSLTYGGRAALDRPAPHITGGEQPRQACFER